MSGKRTTLRPTPTQDRASYSRGLGPGGVLPELAVVDGEVGPVVTAVLQRRDGATGAERLVQSASQTLKGDISYHRVGVGIAVTSRLENQPLLTSQVGVSTWMHDG